MKYLKYCFAGGIILMCTSSYTAKTSRLSEGINPGNLIPDFVYETETGKELKISDLKGKKVLVNFWAAYDAESRMENVLFWNTLHKEGKNDVLMVSVCFDENKTIYERTLQMDGIQSEFQIWDSFGKQSTLYKNHKLDKGFTNYLVNEEGVIIAKNVTHSELNKMLDAN